jgi:ATP adenylyltransferase
MTQARQTPPTPRTLFRAGTLWASVRERAEQALARGVLQPIPTTGQFVEDGGVCFYVRVVDGLARKEVERRLQEASSEATRGADPFMPPDPALFVTDVTPTHFCLLNKFNVAEHHLLIVTRAFEHQESLLTLEDFHALWVCMAEHEGLGFYNSGEVAGASQPHKHLQVVSLPLVEGGPPAPVEPLLATADGAPGTVTSLPLPYRHAFTWLDVRLATRPLEAATATLSRYRTLMDTLGLFASRPPPYNLLVARSWMLLIPRRAEKCQGISVNALGFAGTFLVRDREELARLTQKGPMAFLHAVSVPLAFPESG